MLYYGLISEIDAASGYVRVNIPHYDIVTELIPYLRMFTQDDSMSIPLSIDEQVVVGRIGDDRWVVLGPAPSDDDKPYSGADNSKFGIKFKDGTLIEYDKDEKQYTINSTAKVQVTGATLVKITAPSIELNGAVTISGALSLGAGLTVNGNHDITTGGDIKAGTISFKTHKHLGVTTGGGVSGVPQ